MIITCHPIWMTSRAYPGKIENGPGASWTIRPLQVGNDRKQTIEGELREAGNITLLSAIALQAGW